MVRKKTPKKPEQKLKKNSRKKTPPKRRTKEFQPPIAASAVVDVPFDEDSPFDSDDIPFDPDPQ